MPLIYRNNNTFPLTAEEIDDNFEYIARTVYTVENYGAIGDGVTDDTLAIQAALAAADAAGGGIVDMPDGTFIAAGLVISSNVTLRGTGPNATILKLKNNANTYLIASDSYVSNSSQSDGWGGLRDLTIDGNTTNNTSGHGLVIRSFRFTCERVRFIYCAGHGALISELSADSSALNNNFAEINFRNCWFDINDGAGVYLDDDVNNRVGDVTIDGCVFNDNGKGGVYYQIEGDRAAGTFITNCRIYGGDVGEIYLQSTGGVVISNNFIDGTHNTASGAVPVRTVHLNTGGYGTVVFTGNHIYTRATVLPGTATAWELLKITAPSAVDISIAANMFYSETLSGVIPHLVDGTYEGQAAVGANSYNANCRWTGSVYTTKTGNFTVDWAERKFIINSTAVCVVTLPSATTWAGQELWFKTINAQALISASANVVPLDGDTATALILPPMAGGYAKLVSNGTTWEIVETNATAIDRTAAGSVGTVNAIGGSATAQGIGCSISTTGTATARTPAVTNKYTSLKRVSYATAASADAAAGTRVTNPMWYRGDAANVGGFECSITFGMNVYQAGLRLYAGLTNNAVVPSGADPSAQGRIIGIGKDAADTTLQFMHNDNSGTATKVDLGANFPADTSATDVYRASFWCHPNGSTIYYKVERLNTGHVATGSVTTDIPETTIVLAPQVWINTGAGSVAVEVDMFSMQIRSFT